MTKKEAIAEIKQAIDEAEQRKLWADERGEKEIGWREFCFANGLRWALGSINAIEIKE